MSRRTTSFPALLTALTFALSGLLAIAPAGAETTLERIKREGKIKVGIFNEVPAGFVTPEGEIKGESPDILRAVLDMIDSDIDMEAHVVDEFGALIPGLLARRFDIIAAGLYIKPERCEQIAFTRPTVKYGESLIVKKGNPLDLHSYEDVRDHPEAVIAVATGGMEVQYAKKEGIPEERILLVPNYPTALTALRAGRAHAIGPPATVGQSIVNEAQPKDIELADPFHDPVVDGKPAVSYAGLGVRKADQDLLAALNQGLDRLVNTDEHLAMIEPYGFGRQMLPGDTGAEEICAGE